MHPDFAFQDVLVVANGRNVFSDQLAERGVPFTLTTEDRVTRIQGHYDLIIVVNKATEIAVSFKGVFPDAQVVYCRGGGAKNFLPQIGVVFRCDYVDFHPFADWDEFIKIIGSPIPYRPPLLQQAPWANAETRGETQFCFSGFAPDGQYSSAMRIVFDRMLRASCHYLDWCQRWLTHVGQLRFPCRFTFPRQQKRVRRLTFSMLREYAHQGIPVIDEETIIRFWREGDSWLRPTLYLARVMSVSDGMVTCEFNEPVSVTEAAQFHQLGVHIDTGVVARQCQILEDCANPDHERWTLPLLAMAGRWGNYGSKPTDVIQLTPPDFRRLAQDRSQTQALQSILSDQPIVLVQGPAGTGKSTVITEAVNQFYRQQRLVLLVAHSNAGLDNLVAMVAARIGSRSSIIRLGNNAHNITPAGIPFHRSSKAKAWFGTYAGEITGRALSLREVEEICRLRKSGYGVILACTMASFLIDETLWQLRFRGIPIDVSLIEESSRGRLHEVLGIVSETSDKVVFVGDPDQLGNVELPLAVREELVERGMSPSEIAMFNDGWFSTAIADELFPANLLNVNRRSLPVLTRFGSSQFYGGRLVCGRFNAEDAGIITLYDTSHSRDGREERNGTSWRNRREANLVVGCVVNQLTRGVRLEEIGIITPYNAQIELIRGKIRQVLACHERLAEWRKQTRFDPKRLEDLLNQTVNTVDAFQGSQRRIIILSMVRANDRGEIGFNTNFNRLRVAFTRAQDRLVVFANAETFLNCGQQEIVRLFRALIDLSRQQTTYQQVA